jgi:hypothetical protein
VQHASELLVVDENALAAHKPVFLFSADGLPDPILRRLRIIARS